MTNIAIFVQQLREGITDFRKPQGIRYHLHNLLTIMVLAIATCCEDFEAMAAFCRNKAGFLIANGLPDGKRFPSHDLFRWLLQNIGFYHALLFATFSSLLSGSLHPVNASTFTPFRARPYVNGLTR